MSFRTYINENEWLGNNILPGIIAEELRRQGCVFDEDGCVFEPFQIKDLDGIIKATEA